MARMNQTDHQLSCKISLFPVTKEKVSIYRTPSRRPFEWDFSNNFAISNKICKWKQILHQFKTVLVCRILTNARQIREAI